MSRFRRAVHSAASGYLALIAAGIYSLASVPVAMHYLSKERFGLWALMTTIGGYFSLIDFGMSGAVARLLIDHKDERQSGRYGSLIKTGWLVLVVQAAIIWVAGFVLAPILSHLLTIPAELELEFISLLRWQCTYLALSFVTRIFTHILQAHQRIDLINYFQTLTLAVSFGLLWAFFHAGHGVYSLVWVNLLGSSLTAVMLWISCCRLRMFPGRGAWGHASWEYFRELFGYGKDLFLVAVGNQLIVASQTMIITRRLGLEAAAMWAVGTRMFTLVSQIIWRISDVSWPALSEMLVRRENQILRERYKALVILTASLSGFAAVAYVLCNSLFVSVWVNHRIAWSPWNDLLLAVWLIILSILHCHNGLVLMTKKVAFMRYVYFIEGIIFVCSAFLTAKPFGLPGIISCSIICSSVFSCSYGVWRVSKYFDLSIREVALHWLAPMGRVLALFAPAACLAWWFFRALPQPIVRLSVFVLFSGSLGFYLFLRYGLSRTFQTELLQRAPKVVNPILRRVFFFLGSVP
jgi:O-antigen/teichoic acid export membrane protein